MGFFRRLFGAKKSGTSSPAKEKRKLRSSNMTPSQSNKFDSLSIPYDSNLDANKHAIAVAAATAAVAEAALAAAQAAAEVVRLTNCGGSSSSSSVGGGGRYPAPANINESHRRWVEELAVIKLQSAFRGYLARRALRALKALVKLQALVRGHIVRKQTADMLRRIQTLVRVQARARASRAHTSESWHSISKSFQSRHAIPTSLHQDHLLRPSSSKFEGPSILKRCGSNAHFRDIVVQDKEKLGLNWLDHWMEESLWNNHSNTALRNRHVDDEKSDKILEVDTWKPHVKFQQSNRHLQTSQHILASDLNNQGFMMYDCPSKLSAKAPNAMPSVSSGEVLPLNSLKLPSEKDDAVFRTAENSPHMFSATSRPGSSSRRGPFTPTRSECSWGFFNGYSSYPNYMANTKSSRAKVRSQSAPRQRVEFEKYGPSKRSVQGYYDADTYSERGFSQCTEFRNKAYPASGSVKRVGPVGSSNFR